MGFQWSKFQSLLWIANSFALAVYAHPQEGRFVPEGNCSTVILESSFSFGSAFDAFCDAGTPVVAPLVGTRWRLTGYASACVEQTGIGSTYNPHGVDFSDVSIELEFLSRSTVASRGYSSLLFWNTANEFVMLQNWGIAGFQPSEPVAVFQPDTTTVEFGWGDQAALKQNSITFAVPLFGDGGDLFPFWGDQRTGHGQLFCRRDRKGLICFFEKSSRTIAWLRFEEPAD